ncbi:MAG: hypothetical protein CMK64_05215 [Pseudoalteromonas sp.]|nr:hypothetical protein [Pseudoalteromonas sp.]|tara:strand:- start:50573 stop:51073 length:501 start_codon:yes stop_codon:yes gene_type:complete
MKLLIVILLLKVSFFSFADNQALSFVEENCSTNSVDTLLVLKIITHESKAYYKGKPQPWPWTLNVNGRGYWFDSYEEALTKANSALKNGARKLGIGLGQIEWKYHKHRFDGGLAQALKPKENIKAVCSILDEGREAGIENSFELAAYYHRPIRDQIAFEYAKKVFK